MNGPRPSAHIRRQNLIKNPFISSIRCTLSLIPENESHLAHLADNTTP